MGFCYWFSALDFCSYFYLYIRSLFSYWFSMANWLSFPIVVMGTSSNFLLNSILAAANSCYFIRS
jgi:hypothetical protein